MKKRISSSHSSFFSHQKFVLFDFCVIAKVRICFFSRNFLTNVRVEFLGFFYAFFVEKKGKNLEKKVQKQIEKSQKNFFSIVLCYSS